MTGSQSTNLVVESNGNTKAALEAAFRLAQKEGKEVV